MEDVWEVVEEESVRVVDEVDGIDEEGVEEAEADGVVEDVVYTNHVNKI